ncbi:hypothetical protein DSO57_1000018 [Entomophthora muscae]|uniref:Uncharacterized protein n=1 Tax=Entomophthora muscae TaxID=34485 RepID=A0ACC2SMA7_9FUNG|nr:hypothetical protein DSO57_1000018 [Entomophthora muscae]
MSAKLAVGSLICPPVSSSVVARLFCPPLVILSPSSRSPSSHLTSVRMDYADQFFLDAWQGP